MSRDIQTVFKDATEDPVIEPFYTVEIFLDTNTLRTWTGYGTLTIDGIPFEGTGELLTISSVEETAEITASGITINLSGVPSDLLAVALSEPYQGRVCKVGFGIFNQSDFLTLEGGDSLLLEDGDILRLEPTSDPIKIELFSGYMDEMNILEDPETSTIELRVENKLIDLEKPRVRRYTPQDQKSEFPFDAGFDYIETLQDKRVVWRARQRD